MLTLYNLSIHALALLVRIASSFNPKAKQFVNGRSKLFSRLEADFSNVKEPIIWVHCASLGEFEQGRPVMEWIKEVHPHIHVLLTFFSPSGLEAKKSYKAAHWIYYLPWDTKFNATHFVRITQPRMAIFIKYEFWHNYAQALNEQKIPLISVSCNFRSNQIYFKGYGSFFRNILRQFNHFFVQNQKSIDLLKTIGISQCTLTGDTRFDRVHQIQQKKEPIEIANKFKGSATTFVVGSCWPEDFSVLAPFINQNESKLKFIIAPHEIEESFISEIEKSLQVKCIRYSNSGKQESLEDYSVLIIDNIGMLSKLYQYGEFAFVGGAFGKGLHNILEAACQGIPVFFGNKNYQKFEEAKELIMRGGAFEVRDYPDLKSKYELMVSRPENYLLACEVTESYVVENLGATSKIVEYCKPYLEQT